MEKLVYCLWRPEAVDRDVFATTLRRDLADELERLGAVSLRVCVADREVDAGARLRLTGLDGHKEGYVTFWLEASQDRAPLEAAIASLAARIAGYLVVESRPLVPVDLGAERGARSPGWVQVTGIVPKLGMAYEDFLRHWYDVHRRVAVETQSSTAYVRNEIVRPLTADAPGFAAIVEETFPTGALSDPRVFYDGRGSEERFQANARRMLESVSQFLALDQVDAHPMSEYVYGAAIGGGDARRRESGGPAD